MRGKARVSRLQRTLEMQDEWTELEKKMDQFADDGKLKETGSGLSETLGHLGHELKPGYKCIREAIKD